MKNLKAVLIVSIIFLLTFFTSGADKQEEEKVLEIVNTFFKVLEIGDMELAKEILMVKGSNFSIREEGESFSIRFTNYKTLIESLPKTKGKYKEVINNPKILIHKNIAVVWAQYKFYIDGKFSHCGVDSFSLIRDKGKWKIASIIYTVEKKGCE